MAIVCLDPGHGIETAGKRSPDGTLREYEFNQDVAWRARKLLQSYGVTVICTRENEKDISLSQRTQMAINNKAQVFISIHANAAKGVWGTWGGFEVYYQNNDAISKKLAVIGHKHGIEKTKLRDRGVKSADFQVLRNCYNAKIPAILFEFAFMDNKEECELLKTSAFRQSCAEAVTRAALEYLGISFEVKKDVFVLLLNNQQISSHNTKDEAIKAGWNEYNSGKKNVIMKTPEGHIYTFDKHQDENPNKNTQNDLIMGNSICTARQMDEFVKSKNPNAPSLAEFYLQYGKELGIRGDVAFCQAIKETGYFKFGGDVKASQNNFCGLGATGGGAGGASFATPAIGVLAHIQHLYAYASTASLPQGMQVVDPRFNAPKRGIAKTWQELNGKWAVPGNNYGQEILAIYEQLKKFQPSVTVPKEDGSDTTDLPQHYANENVFYTRFQFNGNQLKKGAIIIDGNAYVDASDIADMLGYTAKFDTLTKEIVFFKK